MNEERVPDTVPGADDPTRAELAEAVQRIDEALDEEGSLRTRTEGVTWILWGLVTVALVLSFDAVAWMFGGLPSGWGPLLWVPWVVLGALLTGVLWRSAALSRPELGEAKQGGLRQTAVYLVFILVAWAAVVLLFDPLHPDNIAVIAIGTAWTFFAAVNPFGTTTLGKRVMLAIGIPTMLVGIVVAVLTVSGAITAVNVVATLASLATTGGLPIAGGAWQATRG